MFQDFLNINNIKKYSRNTYLRAVFAKKFNRTIRDLLKRPVFEKRESNWIDCSPIIPKQNNIKLHSLTKLSPIQAIFWKEWRICLQIYIRRSKENQTKVSTKRSRSSCGFKENFLKKVIQRAGLVNCIKLQNLSTIQNR